MGTLKDKITKKKKVYKMEIDETQGSGVYAISLVSDPAIEAPFVYLSKQFKPIKLAQVDGEKRILVGPVLIPNKEIPRIDDQTGEEYSIVFTPEVVEKAAQLFLQQQKNNEATIEHTDSKVPDISVVESWIVENPYKDKQNMYGMEYPKGTWMVKMKINNEKVWQEFVKTGEVKGFSLEGMFGHELVEATWGVEDVPSSDSSQSWPNNTQYPHGIANRPNHVPYNERNMDNKYPATGFPATRFSVQMSKINDEADEVFADEMITKIAAVLMNKEVDLESYTDYPDSVKNNAKRGIDLNEKNGNKCATPVGKIRAQQLAKGEPVSLETIKRMYSYLSRAAEYYNESDSSACGTISYLLWGGKSALSWSESKLKELDQLSSINIQQLDSEVFMAQKSLETISKAAEELKSKIGNQELDIPAWIQDHIVNAENYINQANDGFYFEEQQLEGEGGGTTTSITSSYTGQFGPATAKKKNKKKK